MQATTVWTLFLHYPSIFFFYYGFQNVCSPRRFHTNTMHLLFPMSKLHVFQDWVIILSGNYQLPLPIGSFSILTRTTHTTKCTCSRVAGGVIKQ